MRLLDWLIAVPGVLIISGWLIKEVAAVRRHRRAARDAISAGSLPARGHAAVLQVGPLACTRRPDPGHRIAARGRRMTSSALPGCSPAGRKQLNSGGLTWRDPDPPGHELVPRQRLRPPQPGGNWPQPSLN